MKILIVDDHDLMRGGLRSLLETHGHDVIEARGGAEALEIIKETYEVEVMFLDLSMPNMDGIETILACLIVRPRLPVIVLSSSEAPQDVRRAIKAGAMGYLPKTASMTTLVAALDMVMQGDVYIPPLILNEQSFQSNDAVMSDQDCNLGCLTMRQMDVLQLVITGMSNKQIARALSLSEKTVKVHMSGIFRALNVVNRTQAVAAAQQIDFLKRA